MGSCDLTVTVQTHPQGTLTMINQEDQHFFISFIKKDKYGNHAIRYNGSKSAYGEHNDDQSSNNNVRHHNEGNRTREEEALNAMLLTKLIVTRNRKYSREEDWQEE